MTRLLGVLALLCWAAAPAAADLTDDDERAKAHFLAGQSYYDQASYNDALKEFNEAYRISKKPALLYNVARCFEGLGQYGDAVAMLERYLQEEPTVADRTSIEERIRNLRAREAPPAPSPPPLAAPPPAPPPAKVTTPPPAKVTSPPPVVVVAPPAPSRPRHRASLVVGAIGVAALAGALGTGIASQLDYDGLHGDCPNGACASSVTHAQSRIDDGKALSLATDVLWPVGAAALLTSVVLFVVESRHHAGQHARLDGSPSPGALVAHF